MRLIYPIRWMLVRLLGVLLRVGGITTSRSRIASSSRWLATESRICAPSKIICLTSISTLLFTTGRWGRKAILYRRPVPIIFGRFFGLISLLSWRCIGRIALLWCGHCDRTRMPTKFIDCQPRRLLRRKCLESKEIPVALVSLSNIEWKKAGKCNVQWAPWKRCPRFMLNTSIVKRRRINVDRNSGCRLP